MRRVAAGGFRRVRPPWSPERQVGEPAGHEGLGPFAGTQKRTVPVAENVTDNGRHRATNGVRLADEGPAVVTKSGRASTPFRRQWATALVVIGSGPVGTTTRTCRRSAATWSMTPAPEPTNNRSAVAVSGSSASTSDRPRAANSSSRAVRPIRRPQRSQRRGRPPGRRRRHRRRTVRRWTETRGRPTHRWQRPSRQ